MIRPTSVCRSLQPENDHAAVGNFREHDFVREFDELANDKLEELSHAFELSDALARCPICASRFGFESAFRSGRHARGPLSSEGLREPGSTLPATDGSRLFRRSFAGALSAGAVTARALLFFNRLRTVSDGCAPRAIQCSARSIFNVLFSPGIFGIVGPDDLDEFPVARAAAVGHDDFVIRAILCAFSA